MVLPRIAANEYGAYVGFKFWIPSQLLNEALSANTGGVFLCRHATGALRFCS